MNNSLEAIKISDRVYWVGAIDNEIRDFHGYSTLRGTTYNAYLILGEKPILIDTVKAPFFSEMMARISSVIEPEKISYIISNHAEMDHSGSLLPTIEAIQPEKVFASKMGIAALKSHFHSQLDLTEIKNGGKFTLGDASFECIETRMLHWPDSMFTYFADDKILFSQDGFGMHLATDKMFADQNDKSILEHEAMKYFANILLPYTTFVTKLLTAFPSLNLDIKMLAPDHGPVWRTHEDISWIMTLWKKWAEQKPTEKVVVIYDTMWNSTAKMAKSIADGIMAENVTVKVMPLSVFHRSDVAAELLEAGALIMGSPTINNQMFPTVADALCYLKGLKPQNLIGQAFGSHGWSGEAVKLIQNDLETLKVKLVENPIKTNYVPDNNCLAECRKLGQSIARMLKNGH
ncbi:MAG: flavodoxin domain-containing protein [Gammaproteobacteria bacterium]|nr:flavodoxin domain-containing protein [Gammaproteobacteria bacterium]